MSELETRAVWPLLEFRQKGRTLEGRFPYRTVAVVSDRGRVRKERFEPGAFSYAVDDAEREVHLLSGHSFDRPLASKRAGSLVLEDSQDALTFRATLPPEGERPSWMEDTVASMRAGLVGGVSPGFRVPPPAAVADAVTFEDDPGVPGVQVRVIRAAVLYELSVVTRPAYPATEVDIRAELDLQSAHDEHSGRRRIWL